MVLLRRLIGDALRRQRLRQARTLREVSAAARVSLGYLSEVERGQKEPSSELLASICAALGVRLSDLLREVTADLVLVEPQGRPLVELPLNAVAPARVLEPVGAGRGLGVAVDPPLPDVVAAA